MTTPFALDNPLCVALDFDDAHECRRLAAATEDHVGAFKVGLTAFAAAGGALVAELAERRAVFCDLKLHDIPAQVAGAVRGVAAHGAALVSVHASGGADMVRAAVDAAGDAVEVVAVTVLTSLDESGLASIGVDGPVHEHVVGLAELALDAGARALVCSPLEVARLRRRFGDRAGGGPLLVVPGIRPAGAGVDDQRRTATPSAARSSGADLVVVGRAITGTRDPAAAARRIAGELDRAG